MRTDAQRRAHAKYYAKNREKVKARTVRWREDNREYYLEEQKKYAEDRDPVKRLNTHRKSSLKTKYGLTLEQYDKMLEAQNNCCAICERHKDEFKTSLCVDHSHKTGEIRGLLCTYCNHRVVGKHTDGEKLRKIADYIEQGTGLFVPEKYKTGAKKRRKKRVKDIDS